jgi:hypothetical protein
LFLSCTSNRRKLAFDILEDIRKWTEQACYATGCIMAGFGDLSFDLSGYSAALISCALQTTYLLLVERSGTEKGEQLMGSEEELLTVTEKF